MTDRFITPRHVIEPRLQSAMDAPRWDAAVLCFRGLRGSLSLIEAVDGKPVGRNILWGIEETPERPTVYEAEVHGKHVGFITRCTWGGPQAAILVEELSEMGVPYFVGYGVAGSLHASLPQGTQIAVASALVTDGASRHYTNRTVHADADMISRIPSAQRVVAATVDAVYRETPALIEGYRQQGAQVINMETTPFYAAAAACNARALWLGYISDVLDGSWQSWHIDRTGMNAAAIAHCLAVIGGIETR